jgi:phosphoglycolate phosphatase-like HAD superfamily hydrolase
MPKAIIFDMDGTLLDSVDLHAEAWRETFAHFGREIPFDQLRSQIGKGGDQLLPVFLSKEEIEKQGKEIEKYRGDLFKEKYLDRVKPFPGVRALFEKIIEHGQRPALASSSKGDQLQVFKKIAQIDDLVEAETSSADAEKSKPHPDIFEAAIDRLRNGPGGKDLDVQDIIAVGDTPYDAESAGKAGIRTVGVRCGGFPEQDLRKAGCIAIFDGPEDLLRRYDESPLANGKD